jgi:hypothetical protein
LQDLSEEELTRLREEVDNYTVEGDLRRFNALNIKRLKEIGCYRGRRHYNVRLVSLLPPLLLLPVLLLFEGAAPGGALLQQQQQQSQQQELPVHRSPASWRGGGEVLKCCWPHFLSIHPAWNAS